MRPLVIIFLTIFVNLVGFGIIIPLLPFYAQTFGASPLVIGLLFASFSLSQLVASPMLGGISDRWGRRPVLIFSLLGTVVSFVMLAVAQQPLRCCSRRGSSTACRAATSRPRAPTSPTSRPRRTAPKPSACSAPPSASASSSARRSAPRSRTSATPRRSGRPRSSPSSRRRSPWFWLPETVHRAHAGGGAPWRALGDSWRLPHLRVLFTIDFVYWTAFAVYQTTFALFGARRFGFDAAHTGYLLSAFGFLGVIVQGGMVGPVVKRARRAANAGGRTALRGGRLGRQRADPFAAGVRRDARAGRDRHRPVQRHAEFAHQQGGRRPREQGRVQGAAGALESLGRTLGPVWGNGALQIFGEGTAYGSAALVLIGAAALTFAYHQPERSVDLKP